MQFKLWPAKGRVPLWRKPCDDCGRKARGYKAGDLVSWRDEEWVCVNTHSNSLFSPNQPHSALWARVLR